MASTLSGAGRSAAAAAARLLGQGAGAARAAPSAQKERRGSSGAGREAAAKSKARACCCSDRWTSAILASIAGSTGAESARPDASRRRCTCATALSKSAVSIARLTTSLDCSSPISSSSRSIVSATRPRCRSITW